MNIQSTPDPQAHNLASRHEGYSAVEHALESFNNQPHALIEVLMAAQKSFGFLPADVLQFVADNLHIPLSKVYGVATFYDLFTLDTSSEVRCRVCTGPACAIAGAGEVLEALYQHTGLEAPGETSPDGQITIHHAQCLGLCDQAPAALVNDRQVVHITPESVPAMLRGGGESPHLNVTGEPRIMTAPIGRLAPTDLKAHQSEGAFTALENALRHMNPEQVIAEVKASGLTGRGGAAFPTGLKWELARNAPGTQKYVVCNFDESEPGTFKDRALMEGNPFRVLEGLILNAYAVGADTGYIFVRGEYPRASEIIETALDVLVTANLLGHDILGTGFDFHVEVRHNAGAYICGEETAQFEAIEGQRGQPRSKPPYPTVQGLFGKPTVINNVETLAIVPSLIQHGGQWFRQWGTENSVGLKLFCLSGHVRQPGVVEAPLGLNVRELIERFGGGFDGEPQALLIGGAAGGFLHPDHLDTPLTHEALRRFDVPIGSGVIMVFNRQVDLWQVVEGLAHFFVHETCGQCSPCRLGTRQIYRFVQQHNTGEAAPADFQKLSKLGQTIRRTCLCGLGMTAANPALTYMQHIEQRHS